MSTILPGPALGKRKSIDPCDHSSAKEEPISVDKEEPILADKEQDATVVVGEKEKEGVDEEDCVEIKEIRRIFAESRKELIQEMEEFRSDNLCRICLEPGHFNCPWERRGSTAATLPKVSPGYILLCPRCDKANFGKKPSGDVMCCLTCGCERIRAFKKRCPWCLRVGHRFKEDEGCVFSEEEWTVEEDPVEEDPVLSHIGVATSK